MDNSAAAESVAKHLRERDTIASEKLIEFKQRLWRVARQQLNSQLLGRADPEDIVQSAIGTFFNNLDADQAPARVKNTFLNGWNDVEELLVAITVNKCRKKWEKDTAGKRDVTRTTSLTAVIDVAREPSEDDGLELLEAVQKFDSSCTDQERLLLVLIQRGLTQTEAAAQLGVSQPLISLWINRMIARLQSQLDL